MTDTILKADPGFYAIYIEAWIDNDGFAWQMTCAPVISWRINDDGLHEPLHVADFRPVGVITPDGTVFAQKSLHFLATMAWASIAEYEKHLKKQFKADLADGWKP